MQKNLIIRHIKHGKCWHVDATTFELTLSENCESVFDHGAMGEIKHQASGKCLYSSGAGDVKMSDECGSTLQSRWTHDTATGIVTSLGTGACIHPKGGGAVTGEGTKLVEMKCQCKTSIAFRIGFAFEKPLPPGIQIWFRILEVFAALKFFEIISAKK